MNEHLPILTIVVALGSTWLESATAQGTAEPHKDPVLTAIAIAAEMPALENVVLPPGYREIRIRSDQPMTCCDPRPMLRLVEAPGDVQGSLWLFRTLVLRPGNPMESDDERCAPLGEQQHIQQHICVRPWNLNSGDWSTVAARLEQLGAWALSDPCPRLRIVRNDDGSTSVVGAVLVDAGLLSVQRRVGGNFSTFSCDGPRYRREGDGLKTREIYDYFMGLSGVIPREPVRIAK